MKKKSQRASIIAEIWEVTLCYLSSSTELKTDRDAFFLHVRFFFFLNPHLNFSAAMKDAIKKKKETLKVLVWPSEHAMELVYSAIN